MAKGVTAPLFKAILVSALTHPPTHTCPHTPSHLTHPPTHPHPQEYYKSGIVTCPPSESLQELREACDYLMIPFTENTIRTTNLCEPLPCILYCTVLYCTVWWCVCGPYCTVWWCVCGPYCTVWVVCVWTLLSVLCVVCVGDLLNELSNDGAKSQFERYLKDQLMPVMVQCAKVTLTPLSLTLP